MADIKNLSPVEICNKPIIPALPRLDLTENLAPAAFGKSFQGTKYSAAASYPQPRFFSLRGTFKFWRTFP